MQAQEEVIAAAIAANSNLNPEYVLKAVIYSLEKVVYDTLPNDAVLQQE